jgi:transposase
MVELQETSARKSVVVGVDTHKDFHVAVVIDSQGALLGSNTFSATGVGYARLIRWVRTFGDVDRAGVESTGSYGSALARHLTAQNILVTEVNRTDRSTRRRRGKSDTIDAEAAARAVLGGYAQARAKSAEGRVEMLRMFKLAKESAIKSRTQAINQLKAVLVTADPELRGSMTGLSTTTIVQRCVRLRPGPHGGVLAATKHTLRLLARRIQHLTAEVDDLQAQIRDAVVDHRPQLLNEYGLGPDIAATLLITVGDNPDRVHSEAAFASLCGVAPVEASSGNTTRRRLSRGGDRRANTALYYVALSRMRWDPRTKAYLQRRIAEGKTKREALRCIKRYIGRELYPLLLDRPGQALETALDAA